MYTLNYFNALNEVNQNKEFLVQKAQAYTQQKVAEDDTLGGLGLPASLAVAGKSLGSKVVKDFIKGKLKTGDDEIDKAVGDTIDNEENPLDLVSKLSKIFKARAGARANELVNQAKSTVRRALNGENTTEPSSAPESEINATFQNPIYDANSVDPVEEATTEAPEVPIDDSTMLEMNDLAPERLQSFLEDPTDLGNGMSNRLFDALSGMRQRLASRGVLQTAENQVARPPDQPGVSSNRIGDAIRQAQNQDVENPSSEQQARQNADDNDTEAPQTESTSSADVSENPPVDGTVEDPAVATSTTTRELATTAGETGEEVGGEVTPLVTGEAVGEGLDATGILAPIGALVGVASLIGSLFGIIHHKAEVPNLNNLPVPVFEPGI